MLDDEDVLLDLGATADPDVALRGLVRLLEAARRRRGPLRRRPGATTTRLRAGCSGCSAPAGRSATTWPATPSTGAAAHAPTTRGRTAAGLRDFDAPSVADRRSAAATDALRVAYRRCLLRLAARDVGGGGRRRRRAAELADLAAATLEAALAIARGRASADAAAAAGSPSSRWASAAAASSTTSATST